MMRVLLLALLLCAACARDDAAYDAACRADLQHSRDRDDQLTADVEGLQEALQSCAEERAACAASAGMGTVP